MPAAIAPPRYDAPIGTTPDGTPVMGSRAFLDFILHALFVRVGGATAPSITDLAAGMDDAGLVPVAAPAPAPEDTPDGRLQALEAEVQRLQGLINDLQQGTKP